MRQETINIYQFGELSEKAKEKALGKWNANNCTSDWSKENIDSLKKFYEIFPIQDSPFSREWGSQTDFTGSEEDFQLSGHRLAKYLWNNYSHILWKGKYYSIWSKTDINPHYTPNGNAPKGELKTRYSKIIKVSKNCNLTGYIADEWLLDPIYKFIENPDDTDFDQLLIKCVESWEDYNKQDDEYHQSMEYFEEMCEANGYEFTEDGEMF